MSAARHVYFTNNILLKQVRTQTICLYVICTYVCASERARVRAWVHTYICAYVGLHILVNVLIEGVRKEVPGSIMFAEEIFVLLCGGK